MNRPVSFNTLKELLPFGILLVSITAWGLAAEWRASSNNALTNQRLDTVLENQKENREEVKGLANKLNDVKNEVTRIATLVDRADDRGLLGKEPQGKTFLAMAAPRIAAITPTPPKQEIVYHTTFETKETKVAGESATPTPSPTIYQAPTPTLAQTRPTPLVCVIGICI